MGRDTWRFSMSDKERAKRKQLHPIWRGVGCILMVIFGIAAYFFSGWLLQQNAIHDWIYFPPTWLSPTFAPWLPEGVVLRVVVAFFSIVAGYGLLEVVYAIFFPIELGPTDWPPLRRRYRRGR